jgi:2-aminoethylphosphonate dioxygenase
MNLNKEHMDHWQREGFIHLKGFFGDGEQLKLWTEEMQNWPETPGKWMKYFETPKGSDSGRLLCRIEHFLEHHEGWCSVIQDPGLLRVLEQLFGEPAVLFKEKLNFKLAGGSGFSAHQDAPAFAKFGQNFHITAMISVDASTTKNGCLEMASGRHREGLMEMTDALVLTDTTIKSMEWAALETKPGDLVLFGSNIPHRSSGNQSTSARRAAYITFNGQSQGSFRDAYYADKRAVFPPEIERVPGKDYSNSGLYNVGNPIRT